ncbi:class II peroxidase [Polychaeton citri CBS 116435]|uniref:Peroxidase n=1 Tax=Polychaeton citri CBS 116435 TaxID=1314669 RepID=A0A9P4UJN3_9PEZI|nr:class II peroxidase [Polychaeton citri CBS 116435]
MTGSHPLHQIRQAVEEAADAPDNDEPANNRMIGDLATVGATTPVGQSIQNILLRTESAESKFQLYVPPGLPGTKKCKADTCCIWWYVSLAMTAAFNGPTLRCNDVARAAIRLGFHDAGTWSSSLAAAGKDFGGADGSLILAGEISRPENKGLEQIVAQMKIWQKTFGVGMADLIQFGANHAVVTCPLGPRIRTFVGRKDSSSPAPDGLLPSATAPADDLIKLFEDKTISAHELAALMGAHSTSRQFNFNSAQSGAPQDGTPGVWDVLYYNQTVQNTVPKGVLRLPSDIALAAHPSISPEWQKFSQGNNVGQKHWNEDYATAYTRLSLLGVNNINNLTECSRVLPPARPDFLGAFKLFVTG